MPADSIVGEEYSEVLNESVFVPSPFGSVHPECYRTYEALACGAIPIVDTDYYLKSFGAPIPFVRDWKDAPELIAQFLDNPVKLESLQSDCNNWLSNCIRSGQENIFYELYRH